MGSTTATKRTARKSGTGWSRTANKSKSLGADPDKNKDKQSQASDLGDQPGDLVEEPQEDPKTLRKPPKGSAVKGTVSKNTRGTYPKGQSA